MKTKKELNDSVNETVMTGKRALELVRDTIAPGQWKKLGKNDEFAKICRIYGVEI